MKNNKIMCQVPETNRQSSRISMEPNIYGQHNLTVKHLLFPKNVNFSSTMSVLTIDNTLRFNKKNSVKKERKGINTENNSVTLTKKTKAINEENQPDLTNVDVYSYHIRIVCILI